MTVSVNGEETDSNPTLETNIAAATNYDATKADYAQNALVKYNNAVYKAKVANPAAGSIADTSKWELANLTYSFTFTNVEIDKSGKVKFMIDTYDNAAWNSAKITFSAFKASSFVANAACNLKYDESGKTV